ncbi:hypothetical protein N7452_006880 [Penicillium brevicompactum]|uniref:Uncharacterized protein n=1 Tax=Penicillium brevicompactum TaxID=5074 RepID=A0A9W9QEB9_PENBR|nr:hypothetical protein N7452_006880 [Penicillium brevicompactum]
MASVTCLALQPSLTLSTKSPIITELERCEPISPSEMAKVKRIDPPSPRRSSQPSTSTTHSRSASRSTTSRPNSRRSSLHSARRTVPNGAIVPVPSTRIPPQERRESLIALHRESCRLFQETETETGRPALQRAASTSARRESRSSTEKGSSAPSSPIVSSRSSFRFEPESPTQPPHFLSQRDRSNTMPTISPSSSSIHVPATVMEWTSDDTRRREYEKIDRASSGVRGFWRRVAPRCFQTRDARVPFFEEGKPEREGSVRRFRMDLPDDAPCKGHSNVLSPSARRRWTCLRSKTSPLPNA